MRHVEVVTFKGCEPTAELINRLDELQEEGDLDLDVELTIVPSPQRAEAMGLFGSPTLRIDGVEYQAERHGPPGFY